MTKMTKMTKMKKKIVFYLIILLRFTCVAAFFVFHPFTAYLIGFFLDMIDGPIYKHYLKIKPMAAQRLDKALDVWLYSAAIFFAVFFHDRIFVPFLIGLYLYRVIGQVLFLATADRVFLMIFMNFFEIFYLFFYFLDFLGQFELLKTVSPMFLYPLFLLVVGLKLQHELALHFKNWTAFDSWWMPLIKKAKVYFGAKA